jgi:hypothetical protein
MRHYGFLAGMLEVSRRTHDHADYTKINQIVLVLTVNIT